MLGALKPEPLLCLICCRRGQARGWGHRGIVWEWRPHGCRKGWVGAGPCREEPARPPAAAPASLWALPERQPGPCLLAGKPPRDGCMVRTAVGSSGGDSPVDGPGPTPSPGRWEDWLAPQSSALGPQRPGAGSSLCPEQSRGLTCTHGPVKSGASEVSQQQLWAGAGLRPGLGDREAGHLQRGRRPEPSGAAGCPAGWQGVGGRGRLALCRAPWDARASS